MRDKEKLAELLPGGSAQRPIEVASSAVVEIRARAMPCPLCEGELAITDHRSAGGGVRPVDVRCRRCGIPRTLWFRIAPDEPN